MSYKFFQNKECEFFPCHEDIPENEFNCLFCFCPLYYKFSKPQLHLFDDCGGSYSILDNGIKDCSNCKVPHLKKNYDYIIKKLME